ncbi:DUF1003 domain-containing protein [Acinetobacter terrae]|jgi:uncharacterized membrane protein|uniref:DUF1003 domain-containing protein n=1 Tax=Acinetobacter terrae TaxID=2731247 RepID=A0ABX1V469_9GAMM|nr:DUF1003 domain-containing protein [Acinetobacter terrae]NNH15296.1 DUF1003 domain-containing protein [Acinetobacter terrae]NNH88424.1 DUF1003 domain-containing protein [Acinetobacter terrae]OAL80263.1 hypothetical protein AY608_05135 [Acinetobacter terrae]OTG73333.1 hypothetical protein B9T23_13320 [Acinetobacter terrae]
MNEKNASYKCIVCGKHFPIKSLIPMGTVRKVITEAISQDFPEWSPHSYICQADLTKYRIQYVHSLLKSEKGEVTDLEYEVINSMQQHELITKNVETKLDQNWTFGERLADKIASFGGSWAFLICFAIFLAIWIIVNTVVMISHPADPYPFILLNLILSCIAAIQAPVIMMSQNRQEAKDRLRSQNDYQINLKAELEIQHLHEKLDHLLMHQWDRLAEIQEIQLELLSEMSKKH